MIGMTSARGRCHTFDKRADGYVRAEGCNAVVLGDAGEIQISGCSVRQDGKSASLTAPNGQAQQVLLEAAHVRASLPSGDFGHSEAHGTGTPLGEPYVAQRPSPCSCEQPFDQRSIPRVYSIIPSDWN